MQIDVTLDVYKALTALLQHEGHTYSDVIREALGMDSPIDAEEAPKREVARLFSDADFKLIAKHSGLSGFVSRGLNLQNGTQLRARYKQKLHSARIENDEWIDEEGRPQSSPSAAASAITGNNVNGLRFWEALRPGDKVWRRLDTLS